MDLFWTPLECPSNPISKDLEDWMFHNCNIQRSKTLLDYHENIVNQLLTPQHLPPCISLNYVRNPNYKMGSTSISLPQRTTFYTSSKFESIEHEATWVHNHSKSYITRHSTRFRVLHPLKHIFYGLFFCVSNCILHFIICPLQKFFFSSYVSRCASYEVQFSYRVLFFCVVISFIIIDCVWKVVLMGFGSRHLVPSSMFAKKNQHGCNKPSSISKHLKTSSWVPWWQKTIFKKTIKIGIKGRGRMIIENKWCNIGCGKLLRMQKIKSMIVRSSLPQIMYPLNLLILTKPSFKKSLQNYQGN